MREDPNLSFVTRGCASESKAYAPASLAFDNAEVQDRCNIGPHAHRRKPPRILGLASVFLFNLFQIGGFPLSFALRDFVRLQSDDLTITAL